MGGLPALMAIIALAGAGAACALRLQGWTRAVQVLAVLPLVPAVVMALAGSARGGITGLEQTAFGILIFAPLTLGALLGWLTGALILKARERRRED